MAIGDRPEDYGLHATTSAAKVALPTNYMFGGFAVRNKLPHDLANTLFGVAGDWQAYNDAGSMRFDELVTTEQTTQVSDDAFAYPIGEGLGPLSVSTESVYIHKGRRIALIGAGMLSRLGLSNINFLPETLTWIYKSTAGVARLAVADIGDPPVTLVDEFVLVGVETDATDVVVLNYDYGPQYGVVVDKHAWRFHRLIAGSGSGSDVALEVIGGGGGQAATFDGGAAGAASFSNTSDGVSTVLISNYDPVGYALAVLDGAAYFGGSQEVNGAALFNDDVTLGTDSSNTITAEAALVANASATFNANTVFGNSSGDSCTITATVNAKVGIAATDNAAYLLNVTNAGTGGGVKSIVAGGYAGYFQTDTTSSAYAALFIMPQDADPSSPTVGDLYHHSTRGKLRTRTFNGWESLHSSSKGYVFECTASADQIGLVGTTGNIAGTTISPEIVGNVLVEGSFFWSPSGDTDTVIVILRDNTLGANIISRTIRAKDVDASGARGETIILRRVYTLPSTASRTFAINITTSAAGDVQDIVMSVQGTV
jgi:hypothetical protein